MAQASAAIFKIEAGEPMQKIVNAAPAAGEGVRVQGMVSALITVGIDAGYLVNSRLAKVQRWGELIALTVSRVDLARRRRRRQVDPAQPAACVLHHRASLGQLARRE